ncbi:MAG: SAM-dependent methyltransferase [Myxococcota bacterium]
MDAARYYRELTGHYQSWGGRSLGWHYGYSDPDDHDLDRALLRSNEILVDGVDLSPASRVLDVGFGNGGLAVWLAKRSGCRVTGISIVEEHAALAAGVAREQGVASLCRFLPMDMNALAFAPATFDLVTNQDTFCYALDKGAYLERVRRLLAPGGHWRGIVFSLGDDALTSRQRAAYRVVREGFHIPHLLPFPETQGLLHAAGYRDVRVRDLTPQCQANAAYQRRLCRGPLWLIRLRLDWIAYSRDPARRRNRQGHVQAADAFCRGLHDGSFRMVFFSGRNPG